MRTSTDRSELEGSVFRGRAPKTSKRMASSMPGAPLRDPATDLSANQRIGSMTYNFAILQLPASWDIGSGQAAPVANLANIESQPDGCMRLAGCNQKASYLWLNKTTRLNPATSSQCFQASLTFRRMPMTNSIILSSTALRRKMRRPAGSPISVRLADHPQRRRKPTLRKGNRYVVR